VASKIPGAHLAVFDGRSPLPPAGDTDDSTRAIAEFLDLNVPEDRPERSQSGFRVVLFTDLVDHTSMMSLLGDDRGRQALREHEAITRKALRDNGGTEVKTLGDGFMASFTRITDALACAAALQRSFEHRNANLQQPSEPHLNVRIGINAGEPIAEDDDLFGATVILASRIASVAQGGEILASNAVRELSVGNDFTFRDRGTVPIKGFDEDARVWEVEWRSR
jgi:class 3 adenylate cyclase